MKRQDDITALSVTSLLTDHLHSEFTLTLIRAKSPSSVKKRVAGDNSAFKVICEGIKKFINEAVPTSTFQNKCYFSVIFYRFAGQIIVYFLNIWNFIV